MNRLSLDQLYEFSLTKNIVTQVKSSILIDMRSINIKLFKEPIV